MLATPDDRGRNVRPFRPGLLLVLRFNFTGKRPIALPHRVCQAALRHAGWDVRVLGTCVAYGLVMALVFPRVMPHLFMQMRTSGAPPWLVSALCIPFGFTIAAPFFVITAHSPRLAWKRWVEKVVRSGYCASCGHTLDGLPTGEDGCRVCPECGAAWDVRRQALASPAGPIRAVAQERSRGPFRSRYAPIRDRGA